MPDEVGDVNVAIVIPVGAGRRENLEAVLRCVTAQTTPPAALVIVEDGDALDGKRIKIGETEEQLMFWRSRTLHIKIDKHKPGDEQPRNLGVRALSTRNGAARSIFEKFGYEQLADPTHVWFLDSDVMVEPDCLEEILIAYAEGPEERIMVCPYDWLPIGERPEPGSDFPLRLHELENDPRWPSFHQYQPKDVLRGDLAAGLACFSGNLVWPLEEFARVGGFWAELHHGRCEDGELGLRAVAMDVPISFAPLARGWHLAHPVDMNLAMTRNERDVPMLNARHPWVEGSDVFMVDRDGKAFDVRCRGCGEMVPTIGWWLHARECGVAPAIPMRAGG